MGAWGALIMGFFGSLFAAMTLYWQWHFSGVVLAAPYLVFAGIALAALVVIRSPGEGVRPSERAQTVINWSSAAEGIGLFLAANIVINLHRPDLLLPAMALVVGLHFLPMGWWVPFGPFLWLGGALIVAAILGVMFDGAIAGLAAALVLWTAAGMAILRDRRAKAGGRPR